MGGARGALAPTVLGALLILLAAPSVAAAELKIREVFPGSTVIDPAAEYVELQMTSAGQGELAGQELRFFDPTGQPIPAASYVLSASDAEGLVAQRQRTVLLATAAAAALGGDAASPDVVLPAGDRLDPAGGAACFTSAGGTAPADCLVWGSFPIPGPFDPQPLADTQSANESALPSANAAGQSWTRDISRGCPTLLDSLDDTANSANDFAVTAPSPRNNSTMPDEIRCPPMAIVLSGPDNPTNKAVASLTYAALTDEPVSFQCHLDSGLASVPPATPPAEDEWEGCDTQPKTYPALLDRFYRFWVRAKGENPQWGPPASRSWQLDTKAPQTGIDSVPPSPNSGFSVTFAYSSSEPLSSFRCQLDDGAIQICGSSATAGSKSYFDISDGQHTFRVWAKDNAGNEDPSPATHEFSVQRFLGDHTPPDTQILIAPPDPSSSSSASFAYGSSEPASSFECALGTAPFATCPATGVSYSRLPNGPYLFMVRAVDRAGNVDSVPAVYSWRVAAPLPRVRFVKSPPGRVRIRRAKSAKLTFRFKADKPGSSFHCRLDEGTFKPCRSPAEVWARPGRHRFEVYAIDELGNVGTTVARRIVRVAKAPRGARK